MDQREWQEEQLKLVRDWYMSTEGCGVMGEEECIPLAQYEDLSAIKQAEVVTKQVVRPSIYCEVSNRSHSSCRRRSRQNRLNM